MASISKLKKTIKDLILHNPRQLFLVDGVGAMLSAFLLGVVLVRMERLFGIPPSALYVLAAIPIGFAIYDFICYKVVYRNYSTFLKIIAILNITYCVLSVGYAIYHSVSITLLGWAYIISEVLIVLFLARLEMKVANIVESN